MEPRAPEEITIRDARLEDADILASLLGELFSIETDFQVSLPRQRRGILLMLDGCGKHRCVKVADSGGKVVGMAAAQVLISTAEGGPVAMVDDVVVTREWRGRRVGSRLLQHIESWAARRGLTRLQLLADCNNASALAFYHRRG
jgi:ribosomal protein S18 acetylase RimI-like enzyme